MDLPESPGFLITKLARAMANEMDRRLKAYNVTISQWAILKQLWRQEGRSQVELQELLGLEGATVTGLLQRMTQGGLVIRRPDPLDKRVQRVFLTERGRGLKAVGAALEDEINALALEGFSADEKDFFMRLLVRVRHNFEKATDGRR